MSAPSAVLARAALIVASGWTQGSWARDHHGAKVNGASLTATCWCAGDAIFQAAKQLNGGDDFPSVQAACAALRPHLETDIGDWNDTPGRTQREVVDTLCKAAEAVL